MEVIPEWSSHPKEVLCIIIFVYQCVLIHRSKQSDIFCLLTGIKKRIIYSGEKKTTVDALEIYVLFSFSNSYPSVMHICQTSVQSDGDTCVTSN